MIKLRFRYLIIALLTTCIIATSCSDDDYDDNDGSSPNIVEAPHFDIWVTIGGSSNKTILVKSFESLTKKDNLDSIHYAGTGVDVTAKLFQESIVKGQYYYQIPKEKDRFGKYRIGTSGIDIVKEVPFGKNTYKDRRYSHTWIDDKTLVIIAANGEATSVIWTKINTLNMSIISEGTLNLPALTKYSTSGVATYRASDNTIIYSYCHGDSDKRTKFYTAFIEASDMNVMKTVEEDRADFPAATAYGELLQSKAFFNTNGDYYLACNRVITGATSSTQQFGTLLRIKRGETVFDKSYTGFIKPSGGRGKIVTAEFLTTDKALLYIMDPKYTGARGWGSTGANCYYAILDLKTDKLIILNLPFNVGNFSQRSVVLGNKAYIGVNPAKDAPSIYIYDIPTGTLTSGLPIKVGYSFERIVWLED